LIPKRELGEFSSREFGELSLELGEFGSREFKK